MNTQKYKSITTHDMVITSLLIALVFIATRFINIRLPFAGQGGLVHLGNVMIYTATLVFGTRKGAIASAVGMTLFDILSGWVVWAPFTFIIRWIMAEIIGFIALRGGKNGTHMKWNIVAIGISGIWMIIGYYFTEVILYHNWIVPFGSIPGDMIQVLVSGILAIPLVKTLQKTPFVLKSVH
ncbi:MAG: ECF transporter S component [Epulopiscium sp.]|nr:ECF transporter S component [Candidatus Epulonipiscium sp.]